MSSLRNSFLPLAATLLTANTFATAAQAGALSYVSSTGNDANACTLAAPCRTLQHAVTATKAGGEVRLIDSAGYGASIGIGKSITISGDGATVFAGQITINSATAVVTLRDLTLNGGGAPGGSNGVTIQAAKTVHIERCSIHGFPHDGVVLSGSGHLIVVDSAIRDNGINGLEVLVGSQTARVVVTNTTVHDNGGHGISVQSGITTVKATTSANNGNIGYYADRGGELTLESAVATGNGYGMYVGSSVARISNSVVTNNINVGLNNANGVLSSRGDNMVSGNGTNTSGFIIPLGGI
jgi:hypothetical protein